MIEYVRVFLTGGIICVLGQLIIDLTKMTPARLLVLLVTSGVVLGLLGWYEPIAEFGQAGATVPLLGFGYALAKGVMKSINENGWIGIFLGGISATAGGIAAALFFGYLNALIFRSRTKN